MFISTISPGSEDTALIPSIMLSMILLFWFNVFIIKESVSMIDVGFVIPNKVINIYN